MGAFFQERPPEIKVAVAENSERHSMTPTYIHNARAPQAKSVMYQTVIHI